MGRGDWRQVPLFRGYFCGASGEKDKGLSYGSGSGVGGCGYDLEMARTGVGVTDLGAEGIYQVSSLGSQGKNGVIQKKGGTSFRGIG